VYIKVGGLGQAINGLGLNERPEPPSSEVLATMWRPYVETCIQAFDVVVVTDAFSLRYRPLEPLAEPLAYLGREVLPAGVAVLTREYELGIAQRRGLISSELLCLFTEGLEGRTSRERLRSGHTDPLS
jgi:hypothetical protein